MPPIMRNNSSGRKDFSSGMGEDRKNGLFGMRIQNGLEFSKTLQYNDGFEKRADGEIA